MNMTTEQKQIAIAEFEGWKNHASEPFQDWRNPNGLGCNTSTGLPPYFTSRDAICGAVAKLPDWDDNGKDKAEYSERLAYVVGANWSSNNVEDRRRIFEATASQMADALLLTLGHQI